MDTPQMKALRVARFWLTTIVNATDIDPETTEARIVINNKETGEKRYADNAEPIKLSDSLAEIDAAIGGLT